MKATITIAIDTDSLNSVTDSYLAQLWHAAQANPISDLEHPEPGVLAEHIGREVIRRFLTRTEPTLWTHKGSSFYRAQACQTKTEAHIQALDSFARWAEEQPADSWRGRTASDMAREFTKALKRESGPHAIP